MSMLISSRAIIGSYRKALEQQTGAAWMGQISNYFRSDQETENYAWLGQSPVMREWVGGRQAKGLVENGIEIKNKHFEATLEILLKDMRRDKTDQIMLRVGELAKRTNAHFASLLSTLLLAGESTACYDGSHFFAADHSEGSSGTQSNLISVDISELPVAVEGTTTAPSPEQAQQVMLAGITRMLGFLDDVGQPMNEDAQQFLVMVAPSLYLACRNGLAMPSGAGVTVQLPGPGGFGIELVANARLAAETDSMHVFRTDSLVKPMIRQEETGVQVKMKDETSEFAFDNDAIQMGVDSWRNVGYGMWQGCVKCVMI
jgi:phage major head subunit gpT-like protein